MDDVINMESSKYIMPLDSLDIALLPTAYPSRLSNNTSFLWTASDFNLKSHDYYEFEIIPKTEARESNFDNKSLTDNDTTLTSREDIATTICHICDLEVPKAYILDHDNSLKHKAYVKIADVVLDRTRRHMLKEDTGYAQKDDTLYFCGPCSTVVRAVNKVQHEKSKVHKQSSSLDRLLYELVALYTHENNDSTKESNTVTKDYEWTEKSNKGTQNDVNEQKTVDRNIDNNTISISDSKARLSEHELETVEYHNVSKTKPNKHNTIGNTVFNGFVNSQSLSNELDVLKPKDVTVEAKPIVNKTNSNDVYKITNDTYYCPMCNLTLHVNNIVSHLNGNKHAWNSQSDQHYLMREEVGISDLVCRICNVYVSPSVTEVKLHAAMKDHVQKYKNLLTNNYVVRQKKNFYCKPCDLVLMKKNELSHIEKVNHEFNVANYKESITDFPTEEQNDTVNGPISNDANSPDKSYSYYCHVCKVYIPNNAYNISTHNEGARHEKNFKNFSVAFNKFAEDLITSVKSFGSIATTTDENTQIDATENKKEFGTDVISNKEIIKETDNDTYFCPKCNLTMHVNNIESHQNGNKHAWNSKSDQHYIIAQEGETSESLICRVCNVSLSDDVTEIREHVATSDHVLKYENLLTTNYVIRQKENFYCRLCNIVFMKRNELYHVEKLNHKNKLHTFKETVEVPTVEQNFNIRGPMRNDAKSDNNANNIKSHSDGAEHETSIKKTAAVDSMKNYSLATANCQFPDVHYHMDAIENQNQLMCKVCNVVVPKREDCITEHIQGRKHASSLESIMAENHIECVDEEYFCRVCQQRINIQELFIHLNQQLHKNVLSSGQKTELKKLTAIIDAPTNSSINKQNGTNIIVDDKRTESLDPTYLNSKHHFTENKDTGQIICKVCNNLQIPNTTVDIINHAADKTHLDAYKELLSKNLIFESENKTYFCGICECLVPLRGEVYHATGARHSGNYIKATTNTDYCQFCNESTAGMNMSRHLQTFAHRKRLLESQNRLHYCKFCQVLISKNDVDEHANTCHKMAVKDKLCFCTTCDPHLPRC